MSDDQKTSFWGHFFGAFFINVLAAFSLGFIIAFNPIMKQTMGGKYFIWFSSNLALTQWIYMGPIIFGYVKANKRSSSKGIFFAALLATVLFLYLQYY